MRYSVQQESSSVLTLSAVLQCAVGDATCADRAGLSAAIETLLKCLPTPPSEAEKFELSARLLHFSLRIGHSFHAVYPHVTSTPRTCAFVPAEACSVWCDAFLEPSELLRRWLDRYITLFDLHHQDSPCERAATILRRDARDPLNISALAKQVGASRSALVRRFTKVFGIPPREYHARARLTIGITALRNPSVKVTEAGRLAGYRSVKNFNHALMVHLGLRPSEVRRLPDDRFTRLDNVVLPSASQRREAANSDRRGPAHLSVKSS